MSFDPNDWYWFVGSDTTQVYSSRDDGSGVSVGYVPISNLTYLEWRSRDPGNVPTSIINEDELGEVLEGAAVRPRGNGVLAGYRRRAALRALNGPGGKVLWDQENRLRVLERAAGQNKPNLDTMMQLVAYVRSVM